MDKFNAVIEVYGRQSYAGTVSEEKIGDNSFIRIDVPEVDGSVPFTKLFGQKAIFSITPVDEAAVMAWIRGNKPEPINIYRLFREPSVEFLQESEDGF